MRTSQNSCPDSVFRASQQRIEALERALQDAYSWAHTSGRLSELNSIMERAAVPLPAVFVTRTRMARVWEEGCERFPKRSHSRRGLTPSETVTWMLHYTSLMYHAPLVEGRLVREWLWEVAYLRQRRRDRPQLGPGVRGDPGHRLGPGVGNPLPR